MEEIVACVFFNRCFHKSNIQRTQWNVRAEYVSYVEEIRTSSVVTTYETRDIGRCKSAAAAVVVAVAAAAAAAAEAAPRRWRVNDRPIRRGRCWLVMISPWAERSRALGYIYGNAGFQFCCSR